MSIHTRDLPVCNSGQYIYVIGLRNFFFVLQDLIDRINSYFQRVSLKGDEYHIYMAQLSLQSL